MVLGWSTPENKIDEQLLMFSEVIGPLPENLYKCWERSSKYYTSDRVLFNTLPSDASEGIDPFVGKRQPLEEYFDANKPEELTTQDSNMIKALLRRVLQYDPETRPTASQLLQDPCFTQV
jgi:serine/threonine protein kinase